MAITSAMCVSYKKELFEGVHTSSDVYKIALYTNAATLDGTATVYTTSNEVVGTGYTAGGATLAGFTASIDGTTGLVDFSDVSWPTSTFTARGAMIYNSSKSDKAVAVFDFGADYSSTGGAFTITMPAATSAAAVLRLTV